MTEWVYTISLPQDRTFQAERLQGAFVERELPEILHDFFSVGLQIYKTQLSGKEPVLKRGTEIPEPINIFEEITKPFLTDDLNPGKQKIVNIKLTNEENRDLDRISFYEQKDLGEITQTFVELGIYLFKETQEGARLTVINGEELKFWE